MKKDNIFLEQASKQSLSEFLGFDEAKAYYFILTKNEKKFEKEYSYSKRYRLLKSLFELGAVGKFKPEKQDFFSYTLLPPTFLYKQNINKKIIEYLEDLYLKNHSELFNNSFSQIIIKEEAYLLIFFLNYFMKESAKIKGDETLKNIIGKNTNNIEIINNKESKRKIGIIDKRIAFEFFNIQNKNSSEYIGYFINPKINNNSDKDYVSKIEAEMNNHSYI